MKYVVQGSNEEYVYEVGDNNYKMKPYFNKVLKNKTWHNILGFETDSLVTNECYNAFRNDSMYGRPTINISENETVSILSQIFRADLNTTFLHSNKILSVKEDKDTNYGEYVTSLEKYYNMVLKKYPEVKEHIEMYNPKDAMENIDKIKDKVVK
jgi:hypothetical protein